MWQGSKMSVALNIVQGFSGIVDNLGAKSRCLTKPPTIQGGKTYAKLQS